MKKKPNIILLFLFITNLNIFAQANKLVTTTQKVMAEKAISEYCHYLEEIAQGKSTGLAILRNLYIEQFANETWDDIETNELISFDKYFQKLQNKSPNIHFTKTPTRSDFLYYTTERKDRNNNIIKVPFIAVPIEKTIDGKRVKGYIFVRATTYKITNYKDHLPDWALIADDDGNVINKNLTSTIKLYRKTGANGKYGFVDEQGKTIIPFIYDFVWSFHEGLAAVERNTYWGHINKQGKTIIPFIYDNVGRFSEGLAAVKRNDKWGFINKRGETIIPIIYDFTWAGFSEELVGVEKNKKWGFINKQGKLIIPFMYDFAGSFSGGLVLVKKNEKWGFINKQNKTVIPFIYDYAASFKEGLAAVKQNGKWGFINKQGKMVIPFIYDYLNLPFSEGLVNVNKNGKWGSINKQGKIIIPLIYDFVNPFEEGLALVEKNGKYFYINKRGQIINK